MRTQVVSFLEKAMPGLLHRIRRQLLALHLVNSENSWLRTQGFFKQSSSPLEGIATRGPWMNYGVIHFLSERLTKDLRLFEYGSGASTLYWASLVDQVDAIEHNQDWYQTVKDSMPGNVTLSLEPDDMEAYVNGVRRSSVRYDVVVIDGILRRECTLPSIECLSERGVVIVDDFDTKHSVGTGELLEKNGFRGLSFVGLKSGSIKRWETKVFYRDGNCLGI